VNVPVLVGAVPLFAVTNFVLEEGYKTANIASSKFTQLIAPTNKTIKIEALLIREFRALRPALEAMALTSRALASTTGPLLRFNGIPVAAKNGVHLDMQINSLVFTQDNTMRDTLKVTISLVNVTRSRLSGIISGALDVAVGVGVPFI
jgi:hypothetical protein